MNHKKYWLLQWLRMMCNKQLCVFTFGSYGCINCEYDFTEDDL